MPSKRMRYRVEAAILKGYFALLLRLPLGAASATGGALGRWVGPFLPQNRVALRNLTLAYPEQNDAFRRRILRGMWDNLGRVLAEFPFLPSEQLYSRVETVGLEHIPKPGSPVIFISGHLGNWELTYPVAFRHGVPVSLIYRHANNPLVDAMMGRFRGVNATSQFPKGGAGAVRMLRALKNGESLAALMDQKMNEGVAVPFFGIPAMTAPALAQLALRQGFPIIPARVIRLRGARFRCEIYPPLPVPESGDEAEDVRQILTQINLLLEEWIREYPEQWFWVHRRFASELYASGAS